MRSDEPETRGDVSPLNQQPDIDPDDIITQFLDDLNNDICPYCHKPMMRIQIGPDVYAHPCKHRLYRGRVSPKK